MEILVLALLGLVQGLCEFLPVSSSGHLVLLSNLFGIEDSLFVSIILHVATLLAVVVIFRKEILYIIKHPLSSQSMNIFIATIPTCIIVLVLMPIITESFEGGFLPFAFLISAILLAGSEIIYKKRQKLSYNAKFTTKTALVMGIAQGLAVFPGISRSGTTICGGLLQGGEKTETAKFSFLMSIPIIILSMIMEIGKIIINDEAVQVNVAGMIIAFVIAFMVGMVSIKAMIKFTSKVDFKWFVGYLLLLSIISFVIV